MEAVLDDEQQEVGVQRDQILHAQRQRPKTAEVRLDRVVQQPWRQRTVNVASGLCNSHGTMHLSLTNSEVTKYVVYQHFFCILSLAFFI